MHKRTTKNVELCSSNGGLDIDVNVRKPGALHRAQWMAKAIYSMKFKLLFAIMKQ